MPWWHPNSPYPSNWNSFVAAREWYTCIASFPFPTNCSTPWYHQETCVQIPCAFCHLHVGCSSQCVYFHQTANGTWAPICEISYNLHFFGQYPWSIGPTQISSWALLDQCHALFVQPLNGCFYHQQTVPFQKALHWVLWKLCVFVIYNFFSYPKALHWWDLLDHHRQLQYVPCLMPLLLLLFLFFVLFAQKQTGKKGAQKFLFFLLCRAPRRHLRSHTQYIVVSVFIF